MKKIAIVSLGCDKNRVDSERILYTLGQGGYELTNDFSVAEIIIVNTCAFIESAREEAIDTILEMAEYKKGNLKKLLVCGCLAQKYADELGELAEVDAVLGTNDYDGICSVIENSIAGRQVVRVKGGDAFNNPNRIVTTPNHFAYLKIADGCDNFCTFCTIPSIRGRYISRSIDSLLSEAKALKDMGVRELILVAQDVTRFGADRGQSELIALLNGLCGLDIRLRLMYCYPELVTDELIDFICTHENMIKYIDIPMQHASDRILKTMNRKSTHAGLCALMDKLQNCGCELAVRSTFMVGFPTETDDDFKILYDFVRRYKLSNAGIFAYSKEEGTPAARLKGQVPKAVKRKRVNELGELILQNCREKNAALVGKTLRVVYEDIDYERKLFQGRADFSAPDIDGNVYFTADFADVGNTYDVKITGFDDYDLIGVKI